MTTPTHPVLSAERIGELIAADTELPESDDWTPAEYAWARRAIATGKAAASRLAEMEAERDYWRSRTLALEAERKALLAEQGIDLGERPARHSCGNQFGGQYCLKKHGHSGLHGNEGANWS